MRPMTAPGDVVPALKGMRVFVVEDESLLALLLEDMLAELGCAVVGSASTVSEAIDAVRQRTFDVAILDIKLGAEKSFPVAEVLAARGVPFVFATGYGDGQVDDRWRDRQVLQKPFAQDQLAEVLRRAVAGIPRPA
jgi:CheY-like chemotaxis protein